MTWPTDRFQSFRAAPGGGSVTTRPLTSAGGTLAVNFDRGTTGALTVEVLDADGNPVPGYGAADATAITSNALAPGSAVRWGAKTTLPTGQGPLRLRFNLTGGTAIGTPSAQSTAGRTTSRAVSGGCVTR